MSLSFCCCCFIFYKTPCSALRSAEMTLCLCDAPRVCTAATRVFFLFLFFGSKEEEEEEEKQTERESGIKCYQKSFVLLLFLFSLLSARTRENRPMAAGRRFVWISASGPVCLGFFSLSFSSLTPPPSLPPSLPTIAYYSETNWPLLLSLSLICIRNKQTRNACTHLQYFFLLFFIGYSWELIYLLLIENICCEIICVFLCYILRYSIESHTHTHTH